ncbi:general secretion pathway protein GspB [Dasania marina]|uniref:general secretion pathway protein GspB n=1 Tax=Dasania marina TaxID=471499 RepID=UPI00037B0164|nr:general secretion pathway protein GspB [Dasania marina]
MSYILDALKKSDQQRQQGAGPNLQTIHRPVLANTDSPLLKLILTLLLLLLLALAAVAGWYFLSANKSASDNSQQVTLQTEAKPAAEAEVGTTLAQTQTQTQTQPAVVNPPPVLNTSAIRFNDLDANTRTAIPGLTFSFHVYSDNPSLRTIIINNRRVKEGALVEKDLLLEEISPQGVVLIWQNRVRFSIDVVESW